MRKVGKGRKVIDGEWEMVEKGDVVMGLGGEMSGRRIGGGVEGEG